MRFRSIALRYTNICWRWFTPRANSKIAKQFCLCQSVSGFYWKKVWTSSSRYHHLGDIIVDIWNIGKTILKVAKNPIADFVVVDGHLKLTVYLLDPKYTSDEIEVLLGFSENFQNWDMY